MKNSAKRSQILQRAVFDLISIPPLVFRGIRRKLIEKAVSDFEMNITPHNFEIMRLLGEEGSLHMAEIGTRLHIARAQMTQLIDRLVELRIVQRTPDKIDRRLINVTLTRHGRSVLKEHMLSFELATREALSGLSDDELANVSLYLRKLNDILVKL
ncbi:MAG TPA: MarR family transcriptional regulator [Dehalococcoidia bacterium]|nr:MarR family transcriptional regulator [Dehalococcoidia bacterium]